MAQNTRTLVERVSLAACSRLATVAESRGDVALHELCVDHAVEMSPATAAPILEMIWQDMRLIKYLEPPCDWILDCQTLRQISLS